MTEHAHSHDAHAPHAESHGEAYYIKIWAILCVLLFVSILGPMLGVQVITLITAFGIAIVKAWMVASKFMHLNIEKKYVSMLMLVMISVVLLFWFAVAPDVMKHDGQRWTNEAAAHPAQGGFARPKEGHGHHGEAHEEPAAEPAGGGEHH